MTDPLTTDAGRTWTALRFYVEHAAWALHDTERFEFQRLRDDYKRRAAGDGSSIDQDLAAQAVNVVRSLASFADTIRRLLEHAQDADVALGEAMHIEEALLQAEAVRTLAYDRDLAKGCGFCKGRPVGNAGEWTSGKRMPAAACPRCGVRTPFDWERRRANEEQFGPMG